MAACMVAQSVSVRTSRRSSYASLRSNIEYDEDFPTDDGFFDMISKLQSRRMDDQRAAVPPTLKGTKLNSHFSNDEDDLLEMLWRIQSSRIEEQRSTMPGESTPHIMPASRGAEGEGECLSSEDLFELIFRCQSSRINEQRCAAPAIVAHKSTMPSEDFFNLIQHLQSTRIEDQRSPLPVVAAS